MATEQLLLPLPDERPPIREAYHRFCDHLGRPGWLSSVGFAENAGKIVVYLRTERHPELPRQWEGYQVEAKFFGDFATIGKLS